MNRRYRRHLWCFWLFILPSFAIYTLLWVSPMVFSLIISFTSWSGFSLSQLKFVGLRNYINAFNDKIVGLSISHNFIFMGLGVVLIPACAFFVALLVEKFVVKKGFFRTVLFIPAFLPMLLITILFRWVYSIDGGMINSLLEVIGLGALKTDFLGNSDTAIYALFFIGLWKNMPFHMLILLSGLQGIPAELEETAVIDGANFWQVVTQVIIPMLKPIFIVVYGLVIIDAFRVFDLVFVTTSGGPGYYTTEVLNTYIYRTAFESFRLGYSTALSTINILMVSIISLIYFRFTAKQKKERETK